MSFYLMDFKKIGADFVPVKISKVTHSNFRAYGILLYHGEEIKVELRQNKSGVSKIVAAGAGDLPMTGVEEAYDNHQKLKSIRKNALKRNINGLRSEVNRRKFFHFILIMAKGILLLSLAMCILGFVKDPRIISVLMGCACVLSFRFISANQWKWMPLCKGV